MTLMRISASILSCDFSRLGEEVRAVEEGGVDWIHVDVMDGHFVPNISIGPVIAEAVRRATDLPMDVHLMIENPDRYLEAFVTAGAHVLTVHREACPDLPRTLDRIRELGARPGVAINPATPVDGVREVVPQLDLLLVMSVEPGFGGQRYIGSSTDKLKRARRLLDELGSAAELEVDGGVDAGNAAEVARAGASVIVAGSAIYGHADGPAQGVGAIRRAVSG